MMGSFMAMNTHARYYWNGENRMVRMEAKFAPSNGQPAALDFAYDHRGRCVARNGEHFVWDGYNIVAEVADSSNVVYNTWGLDLDGTFQGLGGVGGLLSVDHGGRLSLPTYDANGNVTEYVGLDDGAVLSHSEYSAFGGVLRRNGAAAFSHGFSTKPSDAEGIVRYQFRRYYVGIGRWVSYDNILIHNPYIFLLNSSFMFIEILGMYGNPVIGPGGEVVGPSTPYAPGGPYDPKPSPWYEELPDCPCNIPMNSNGCPDESGVGGDWTSPEKTRHKGGSWEIRSMPSSSGAGQQCVYDSAGKLINAGSGAGTPDMKSLSGNKIGHIIFDLLPWAINYIQELIGLENAGYAEKRDHESHPPNQGKGQNGQPCPYNDGSGNPPLKVDCGGCR